VVDLDGVSRQLLKNEDVRWLAAYDWSPDD
jgi:hypothetical protein